ncbi:hypothetical protein FJZ33_02210 [Candidatus Poribacteria bacterium]|nr:hypothetical protein [Candidatus Poribacteria bacterium]
MSSENGENIKIIKNIDNYIQNKLHLEQDSIFTFEECNYIFCLYRGDANKTFSSIEKFSNFPEESKFLEGTSRMSLELSSFFVTYPDNGNTAVELLENLFKNRQELMKKGDFQNSC